MFLGDRRVLIERLVLADSAQVRDAALEALVPLQRGDFVELFEAMDGLPVTVRLLDPPLHEFLPDRTELAVKVAVAHERGEDTGHDEKLLAAVERLHESNPMLGLRGVRLGLTIPGLFAMQVRAAAEAAADRIRSGGDPRVEIMVPLVGSVMELHLIRDEADKVLAEVAAQRGVRLDIPIGTMIELPRAALTAGRIAEAADFFSFGTNDLTQTAWGFSRDDVEAAFFAAYLDKGVFTVSPFETLDAIGVGRLVRIAVEEGRAARPGLKIGVCGEHGGDPESVHFFHEVGLDYVSCSPFRVPVARLEAGRAAITSRTRGRGSRDRGDRRSLPGGGGLGLDDVGGACRAAGPSQLRAQGGAAGGDLRRELQRDHRRAELVGGGAGLQPVGHAELDEPVGVGELVDRLGHGDHWDAVPQPFRASAHPGVGDERRRVRQYRQLRYPAVHGRVGR